MTLRLATLSWMPGSRAMSVLPMSGCHKNGLLIFGRLYGPFLYRGEFGMFLARLTSVLTMWMTSSCIIMLRES